MENSAALDHQPVQFPPRRLASSPGSSQKGDPGAESVFLWTKEKKSVNRCGAGPMDASLFGRGVGEGLGVHICSTRRCARRSGEGRDRVAQYRRNTRPNPQYPGKGFGDNAAAWWGFHYEVLVTGPLSTRSMAHGHGLPRSTLPRGTQSHRLSWRSSLPLHDHGKPRHNEECTLLRHAVPQNPFIAKPNCWRRMVQGFLHSPSIGRRNQG